MMTLYSNDREKAVDDVEQVYRLASIAEDEVHGEVYDSAHLTVKKLGSKVAELQGALERLIEK